jgi:hypothetical protein
MVLERLKLARIQFLQYHFDPAASAFTGYESMGRQIALFADGDDPIAARFQAKEWRSVVLFCIHERVTAAILVLADLGFE